MPPDIDQLAHRARKLRANGEHRKAAQAFGKLTQAMPEEPRWWVLFAVCLHAAHHTDESTRALRQALYLFRCRRDHARAASLRLWLGAHDLTPDAHAA
jgi:Flp pilus assembly protein TadD